MPTTETHTITEDMTSTNYRCLMPSAQSIKTLDDISDTLSVKSLLTTSSSSYLKTNATTSSSNGSYEKTDDDATGPFNVAVAITDSKESKGDSDTTDDTTDTDSEEDEENIKTKLVVFGTSAIVDSSIYSQVTPYNVSLFTASLGWMCDCKDSISIAAKNRTEDTLSITSSKVTSWAIVYLLVVPAVVLGTGIVITVRRRKR